MRASAEGFPVQGPLPQYAAPGVPTPYAVVVHPYPTRYHGGVWTRPVFGLPYVQDVQSVFKPTDFWECQTCRGQDGLGALSYQTHRGIFGENVRGGGTFGEELRGVGAFGQSTESAPTFMPVLSEGVAEREREYAPALKTSDPRVSELQAYLNRVLSAAGYSSLSVDGKMGPATCGAIAWYKTTGSSLATGTTKARIDENLSYVGPLYTSTCRGMTPWRMPSKASAPASVAPSTPAAPPAPPQLPATLPGAPPSVAKRNTAIVVGAVAMLAVGGAFYFARRK